MNFDKDAWQELKDDAKAAVNRHATVKIAASDISTIVVGKARENAERAGLAAMLEDGRLTFTQCDARAVTPCADHGLVIANPPYGEQSTPRAHRLPP